MCVRIVFVLVLCCVQSWGQRDPTLSRGFQDRAENPDMHPQGTRPPLDQSPVLTDLSEHPDILPQAWPRPTIVQSLRFKNIPVNPGMPPEGRLSPLEPMDLDYADDLQPPDVKYKLNHAGVPRNLSVFTLPLEKSDHELQLNVSWLPSSGVPVQGYSLEVSSVTGTMDCESQMCYQAGIRNVTWILVPPTYAVTGGCAIRPGCAYLLKLHADPWDGVSTANLTMELGECEAGVCSCSHSPRLPAPVVSADVVTINNTLYSNVSWYLPTPIQPQRLPAKLGKQSYIVTLNKQIMNTYFTILKNRTVQDIGGLVFEGDITRWVLLPISQEMTLKLKLLAKVQLVDERGCFGPAGIATVFGPAEVPESNTSFGIFAILGAIIGALAMAAVFALVFKRVLKSYRPAPVSAPLEPLLRQPAWFNNKYNNNY